MGTREAPTGTWTLEYSFGPNSPCARILSPSYVRRGTDVRPPSTISQGKGYGTESMEWLLQQAFKRFNLHKVCGGTWDWNTPARKLYIKMCVLDVRGEEVEWTFER